MKCLNCEKEFQDDMNFCPYCGTKAGEKKKEEKIIEIVKVKRNNNELYMALCQLAMYFGIGMTLVCIFFAFKGFGMLANRQINYVTVWVTFAVSIAIGVAGALIYFLKFKKKQNK